MIVQEFKEEHYKIAVKWWQAHKWGALPIQCLPKTGGIVYDGDTPIVCGFLYRTDSSFCILEHFVSNPDTHYLLRARAIDLLIDDLLSKTDGAEVIMAWLQNERLIEKYKNKGFIESDQNVTALVRMGGGKKEWVL